MYLDTNLQSLFTEQNLVTNTTTLQTLETELATGSTLSNPADNPAESMQTALTTGVLGNWTRQLANIQNDQGYVQTETGALSTQIGLLQAAEQLAVTASSNTLTEANRQALQTQLDGLLSEFNTTSDTVYNGVSMRAQSAAVYHPGSTAVITQITGGSGDPQGSYSIALTPNGASLSAVLIYNGQAVASTSILNPYPYAQLEPAYNGGPPTVPTAWFPIGSEATLAPGQYSDIGTPQDAITPNAQGTGDIGTWNSPGPTMTVQFPTAQTLAGLWFSWADGPYGPWTVTVQGETAPNIWGAIGTGVVGPDSPANFVGTLAVTPGTYLGVRLAFSNSGGNVQVAGGGSIRAVLPSTVPLTLDWQSAKVGFDTPVTIHYNPAAIGNNTEASSGSYAVLSQTLSGGSGKVALTPSLLTTQELGIQHLSLMSVGPAQSALSQIQAATQVISGLQVQAGDTLSQLYEVTATLATQVQTTTDSIDTIQTPNLPQATAALARSQLLVTRGLQMLTTEHHLAQHTAQVLRSMES